MTGTGTSCQTQAARQLVRAGRRLRRPATHGALCERVSGVRQYEEQMIEPVRRPTAVDLLDDAADHVEVRRAVQLRRPQHVKVEQETQMRGQPSGVGVRDRAQRLNRVVVLGRRSPDQLLVHDGMVVRLIIARPCRRPHSAPTRVVRARSTLPGPYDGHIDAGGAVRASSRGVSWSARRRTPRTSR
jgi:hypothetical protein